MGLPNQGTVLVVEDDLDVREAMTCILNGVGYATLTADDGAAGLVHLRAGRRPDVILLDLMMPGMDGYEFRTIQLADAAFSTIPVIVLTADRRRTLSADLGAVTFLPKPFELDELLAAVAGARDAC